MAVATRLSAFTTVFIVLTAVPAYSQSNSIVRSDGARINIRPSMTIRQAVAELRPQYQSYVLGGDSGWLLQIHDDFDYGEVLMSLWSDEFQDYVINYDVPLRVIMLHSPAYTLGDGVHVGMSLAEAEKKLGRIKRIYKSEPAFEEYADFTNMPAGVSYRINGGVFAEGKRETFEYSPEARINGIEISVN